MVKVNAFTRLSLSHIYSISYPAKNILFHFSVSMTQKRHLLLNRTFYPKEDSLSQRGHYIPPMKEASIADAAKAIQTTKEE